MFSVLSIALIVALWTAPVGATVITLDTPLTAVAGTGSTGSGLSDSTFDTGNNTLAFTLSWTGLTTNLTNAHIHLAPTPSGNGGVLIPFFAPGGVEIINPTPPSLPLGTSGTLTENIQITDATTLSEFMTGLSNGTLYVNLHTANFPAGEIRGDFSPVAPVPEPGTLSLLVGGLGVWVGARRLRQLC